MGIDRKYEAPPVVEALCEASFSGSEWDPTSAGQFFERIREDFPNRALAHDARAGVAQPSEGPDQGLLSGSWRMQFHGKDPTRIVQLARELLVINQLRPYPGFEVWLPGAVQMVSQYREIAHPKKLNRVGLRYINRMVIPKTAIHVSEYFGIHAVVPTELGGEYSSFLVRVEVPAIFPHHRLLITLSSEPSPPQGHLAVFLDLYDTVEEVEHPLLDSFEETLRAAHENVAHAFENSITSAARLLFRERTEAHEHRA